MAIHNTCIMNCRHSTQTAVHFRGADKLDSYSEALIIADHASEKFQASSKGCVKAESACLLQLMNYTVCRYSWHVRPVGDISVCPRSKMGSLVKKYDTQLKL